MTWNYRIIRHYTPGFGETYALHEVHYNDAGMVTLWSKNPISFVGDIRNDVISSLERALNDAITLPVLKIEDLRKNIPD